MLLYKYYSPKLRNFEAVIDRKFWFATNKKLNDPYDLYSGRFLLELPATTDKKIHERIIEIIERGTSSRSKSKALLSEIERDFQKIASCSFSTNPIDRLMWGHYADGYSGFCICIEIDDSLIDGGYSQSEKWHRVMYMDQMPFALLGQRTSTRSNKIHDTDRGYGLIQDICTNMDGQKTPNTNQYNMIGLEDMIFAYLSGNDVIKTQSLNRYVTQMLCIKAQEWIYEQEYRLIKTITSPDGELVSWDNNITLKEVILGNNISDFVIDENNRQYSIKNILRSVQQNHLNVKITKLSLNNLRYFALNKQPYKL